MKRQIDLKSQDGNAWFLMANVMRWSKPLDLDGKAICAEMRKSDYRHLCETFEKYFGDYVVLVNKPWENGNDTE